jgi:C1A family cysteine protease
MQGCNGGLLAASVNYMVLLGVPLASAVPYISKEGNCMSDVGIRYKGTLAQDLIPEIENGFPTSPVTISPSVLAANEENVQLAILTEGPVAFGFNVYTDFFIYPALGDIYTVTKGTFSYNGNSYQNMFEGSHACEIVGWGEDSGNKYWICKNSWGTTWGDNGFFKMKRGVNTANMMLDIVGVHVESNDLFSSNTNTGLSESTPQGSLPPWAIALIVIGSLIVLILIIVLPIVLVKQDTPKTNVTDENKNYFY